MWAWLRLAGQQEPSEWWVRPMSPTMVILVLLWGQSPSVTGARETWAWGDFGAL